MGVWLRNGLESESYIMIEDNEFYVQSKSKAFASLQ